MTRLGDILTVIIAIVSISILGWNIVTIRNTGAPFFDFNIVALATILLLLIGMLHKVKPWVFLLILFISVMSLGMLPQR